MNFKQLTKKSVSLVLCLAMLFSCWVFTAPTSTAATRTTYTYSLTIETTNTGDCNDNDKPYFQLWGAANNGKGTAAELFKQEVDPDYIQKKQTFTKTDTTAYFPTKLTVFIDFDGTFLVTRKWEGNITIKVNGTTVLSSSMAMESNNAINHCPLTQEISVPTSNYPKPTTCSFNKTPPSELTVPRTDESALTKEVHAEVIDQFGVLWYEEPDLVLDEDITGIQLSQGQMTISSYANSTNGADRTVKINASYVGTGFSLKSSCSFKLKNAVYDYRFLDANGEQIDNYAGSLKYGITPTAPTVTPTKESSATHHYVFTGWDPVVGKLKADTDYRAQFEAVKHSLDNFVSDGNATCTQDGTLTATCTCGYTKTKVDEGSALGHDYTGSIVVTKEATCTEQGVITKTCNRCHEVAYEYEEPLDHNYKKGTPVAATCEEGGYTPYVCTRCSDEQRRAQTNALGHSLGSLEVKLEATCEEPGRKARTCRRCGKEDAVSEIPALGHNMGEWEYEIAPTCTEGGVEVRECTRCDCFERQEVPATGHNWGEWQVLRECTCTVNGMYLRYCKNENCKESEVYKADKLGHEMELGISNPDDGSTGSYYFYCRNCKQNGLCALDDEGKPVCVADPDHMEGVGAESGAQLSIEIPCTSFNHYVRQESNFSYINRGASLRINQDGDERYQALRFASSMLIPEGAEVIDFGYIFMKEEDLLRPSQFVKDGPNVHDLSVKDGNYSVFQTDGGEVRTFNLVVVLHQENWDCEFIAKPYLIYTFGGHTFTVYDECYAQKSVAKIAKLVMDSPTEPRRVKEYIDNKIIHRKPL